MKYRVLIAGLIASLVSCAPVSKQFVFSSNEYAKVILPDYKEYISKDTSLSDTTKEIRITTADKFQALIDSAMSKLNENNN